MSFFCASCTTTSQVYQPQIRTFPTNEARLRAELADRIAQSVFENLMMFYPGEKKLLTSFEIGLRPILEERVGAEGDWEIRISKSAPGEVFGRATLQMSHEEKTRLLNLLPSELSFGVKLGGAFSKFRSHEMVVIGRG